MPNPFYTNNQFYFKQCRLEWVHSLIVKNISISSFQFRQTILIQIIQYSFCLHTVKCHNSSISKNSVWRKYSFNVKTVLFRAIQLSISTLVSSIRPIDRTLIRCYHYRLEWTLERWQWRGTLHSPKLQHYWNLTLRLFSVISRTLVGESYPSAEMQLVYSMAPANRAKVFWMR